MPTFRQLAHLYGGQPALVDPITPERALYNEILLKYGNIPELADLAIMEADIVSEVVIPVAAASQTIKWKVRADQPNETNAIRTTEIRLETRDAFVCDRLTIMFGNELITNVTPGLTVFQQWPNPGLVAVGGFDSNANGIVEAYNGDLDAIVNSVQFMKGLHANRFLYADYAQRSTLLFTASNQSWNNQLGERGFVYLMPTMDIKGKDTTEFTLNLPDAFNFGSLALNRVVARLILRGMRIQGGADYIG